MGEITLTGKSRFRTLTRGIWPFRSSKLVLQVQVNDRIEIYPDFHTSRDRPIQVRNDTYWRDAKFEDLTVMDRPSAREVFVRENPR